MTHDRSLLLCTVFLLSACAKNPILPDKAIIEPACVRSAIEFATIIDKREGVKIPDGENWFNIIEGIKPVIITAPHATRPMREGVRRFSDGGGTAAMAVALSEMSGATVIYTTYEGPSDPNYYDDNKFKEALSFLIDKVNPKYILDIHGSDPFRSYDIDLGTVNGASLLGKETLIIDLIKSLRDNGINSISYNRFAASKHETIANFSSRKGVPAIQLEINATYITPASGNVEAQRFSRLLQALVRFVGPMPNKTRHPTSCAGH